MKSVHFFFNHTTHTTHNMQMCQLLIPLLVLCVLCVTSSPRKVPSSCHGLSDGIHYILPMADASFPILRVRCQSSFTIIDPSLEPDWSAYFSSWTQYHFGVVGPTRNDKVNWAEWFLPDTTSDGTYAVSEDCHACLEPSSSSNTVDSTFPSSAYYLSALAFGCFQPVRGWPACDFDYDTYACKLCSWDDSLTQISSAPRPADMSWEEALSLNLKTGICDFEVRSPQQQVSKSFTHCVAAPKNSENNHNWKPSLGISAAKCQCWRPSDLTQQQTFTEVDHEILHTKMHDDEPSSAATETVSDSQTVEVVEREQNEFKLFQSDFAHGTYRIRTPGTYVLQEDITLDFTAPADTTSDTFSYNDPFAHSAYWPSDADEYPGAGQARDAYFLGFFAGITIECSDVILDLNHFEIAMAPTFYYQQPYFSIIELASQPFLPQQGPGFFGAEPHFASNVLIKDGTIGLSSHHGIHGNNNEHITISNVHVRHFTTHGVQLNGFADIALTDVEIGPSSERAFLNGNYGQLRLLLPTMARIATQNEGERIHFTDREHGATMREIIGTVVELMDDALMFALGEKDEIDHSAADLFVNPSGLPFGAVLYGLFLNYPSAGIFGWHVNDATSETAQLRNVHIHGLRHRGIEVVGLSEAGRVVCNGFNGPLSALELFGGEHLQILQAKQYKSDETENVDSFPQYKGSPVTDAHIAMYFWGRSDFDNWAGIPFFGDGDKMLEWATGAHPEWVREDSFGFYCNEDAMFHPSKGLLAVKISGVEGVSVDGLVIEDIQDETPMGSELCGAMDFPSHGMYHFAQQAPYQVGFSMNMLMGVTVDFSAVQMRNVRMSRMYSSTGLVYGVAAWFESDLSVDGELTIDGLSAGSELVGDLEYDDLPNKAAEACAVRLFDSDEHALSVHWDEGLAATQQCVQGMVGCVGHKHKFTHFEHVDDGVQCEGERPFELAPATMGELTERRAMQKHGRKGGSAHGSASAVMGWLKRKWKGLFARKAKVKGMSREDAGLVMPTQWLAVAMVLVTTLLMLCVTQMRLRTPRRVIRGKVSTVSERSPLMG